jgi:hypothetical protein
MSENILYRLDPLLICLALIGMLLVAEEVGFRVKGMLKPGSEGVETAHGAVILGALLLLLTLMLGVTYSMSQTRFETRKQLVIDEANAIGTTCLRAKALQEPSSSEIQELLRQYVALRVEIGEITDVTPEKIREVDNLTKQLYMLIWSHAAALARESPGPIVSVFLQSLNEMINLHTKRLAAFRNRVPFSIYVVLYIVSAITLWLVGYCFGIARQKSRILTTILALLVATVMWLILDLDQPSRRVMRTSQQSLIDLYQHLGETSRDGAKKSQ